MASWPDPKNTWGCSGLYSDYCPGSLNENHQTKLPEMLHHDDFVPSGTDCNDTKEQQDERAWDQKSVLLLLLCKWLIEVKLGIFSAPRDWLQGGELSLPAAKDGAPQPCLCSDLLFHISMVTCFTALAALWIHRLGDAKALPRSQVVLSGCWSVCWKPGASGGL